MLGYRTSSLFHFTKKIDVLLKILETGLIPNFCKENLNYYDRERIVGVPMVSFCDIPLTRTSEFKQRYGDYAVGLNKEWAIRNKINPILYVNNDDILVSLGFFNAVYKDYLNQLKTLGGTENGITLNGSIAQFTEGIKMLVNMSNAKDAVYTLYGYVKRMDGQGPEGGKQSNYLENEWRYVVTGDGIDWKWSEEEYKKWRGWRNRNKPVPSDALVGKKLKFTVEDISHIIVKTEKEVDEIADALLSINHLGGNEDILDLGQRKLMLTKIISQEKIEKDF